MLRTVAGSEELARGPTTFILNLYSHVLAVGSPLDCASQLLPQRVRCNLNTAQCRLEQIQAASHCSIFIILLFNISLEPAFAGCCKETWKFLPDHTTNAAISRSSCWLLKNSYYINKEQLPTAHVTAAACSRLGTEQTVNWQQILRKTVGWPANVPEVYRLVPEAFNT